jgi:hypothetical protein
VELLVLDDFGLTPLSEEQQADLYEIICDRYERASTIITSNRDFGEWPTVFSNPLMGSAAMDRLVHRAVKLVIEGKSYCVDNFGQTLQTHLCAPGGDQAMRRPGKPALPMRGKSAGLKPKKSLRWWPYNASSQSRWYPDTPSQKELTSTD